MKTSLGAKCKRRTEGKESTRFLHRCFTEGLMINLGFLIEEEVNAGPRLNLIN